MKNFFTKPTDKLLNNIAQLSRDEILYRVMPHFFLEIMKKYFRLEVHGAEHIPRKGPGIIIPNHSGYLGFDAFMLIHEIHKRVGRVPLVMTHPFWFLSNATAIPAQKLGFLEATTPNGEAVLKKKKLLLLFPEGEKGNFKPSANRYRLQEFKRGFVRLALRHQCPIIPTIVIGAEETHINLTQLKLTPFLRGTVLPLPLNVLPLPAKWQIRFLEPILLPYKASAANDSELVHEIASDVRERMQTALGKILQERDKIFF